VALPVLYDADCGFCRWTLALLLEHDPGARLRPVTLDSPEGAVLLAALSDDERMRSAHVVTADGRVWTGGAAVAPILDELGHPRCAAAARLARPALRAGYRAVAASRGILGRLVGDEARDRATAAIARHRARAAVPSE
jgi:predicted DCC family thiol-disulfide oxidoreductase YuxK